MFDGLCGFLFEERKIKFKKKLWQGFHLCRLHSTVVISKYWIHLVSWSRAKKMNDIKIHGRNGDGAGNKTGIWTQVDVWVILKCLSDQPPTPSHCRVAILVWTAIASWPDYELVRKTNHLTDSLRGQVVYTMPQAIDLVWEGGRQ